MHSIRGRLTLLVLTVLVPAVLLVAWLIVEAYQNERRAVERELVAMARSLSRSIDAALRERETLLRVLATSPHLAQGDLERFREQAAAMIDVTREWVVLIDPQNQQLVNTSRPPGSVLPVIPVNREAQAAAEAGRTYVSNLSVGAASRRPVLFLAYPILQDGRLRYVLSLGLTPGVFESSLLGSARTGDWTVTLLDRAGIIAGRSVDAAEHVGQRAAPAVAELIGADASSGLGEADVFDHTRNLIAFHRSATSGWSVVIAAPKQELFVAAQRLLVVALGVSLLSGAAATFTALWLARAVVLAVQKLVSETEAVGRGEQPDASSTGINETDFVSRALHETARGLAAREKELAQAHAEVVAVSRAKDEFLAALSHELRTPLSPVLLIASDAARDPNHSAAAREAFGQIAKNALLEARLIDDLLDLTRITRGKMALDVRPLDLYSVLRDATAMVRADAVTKELRVDLKFAGDAATVMGDPTRLQQVFWNVLSNAIKFTPARGRIRVSARVDVPAQHAVVEVEDTGIGMSSGELARIFRPFAQGDHAGRGGSHRFGGLGLGLVISRRLVELHRGRIDAFSLGPGRGCTVTVRLPLAPERVPVPVAPAAAPTGDQRPEGGAVEIAAGRRLLLVEDHESTRLALARLLARRGVEVVAVATQQEALEHAAIARWDGVISDLGLPDGNGFELMRRLHDQFGLRGIALTGYGSEEDVARGREAGFVGHLTKPVTMAALEEALVEMLRPSAPANARISDAG